MQGKIQNAVLSSQLSMSSIYCTYYGIGKINYNYIQSVATTITRREKFNCNSLIACVVYWVNM